MAKTTRKFTTLPVHALPQPALLRIEVTSESVSQMLYQPNGHPYPNHGFIVSFKNAALADVNATTLRTGMLVLRARPDAFCQISLLMINRLLQPFQGYFELVVNGTYEYDSTGDFTTVIAESVFACDIQL